MPPERAKKLFLGLHEAVEHTEEESLSRSAENPEKKHPEKEKKGMADGLPLKENPQLDWLRKWEKEN
ncbi:MAG: hypothetical protein Q7R64_03380 [bacterium]|nr:hypothetical protein [bacterium]